MDGNTVAVVAEVTIELTNTPVHFKWAGHGLTLHVPTGALQHHSKHSLHLQAYRLTNEHSLVLPEGGDLVSAIYSISAGGRLEKEVLVEIEHCLSSASDRTKAICVIDDRSTGEFRPSEQGYVIRDSHCQASLRAPHTSLCWVAVAGPQGCATKLSAHLYLQCESLTRHYLHLVLTRNLQVNMKVVDAEYLSSPQTRKLLLLPRVVLVDQSTKVTLSIPREGEDTPTGWRISPTEYPPEITCGPSQSSLRLLVERDGGRGDEEGAQPAPFEYTMKLKGTEMPQTFLVYYTDQTLEGFSPASIPVPDSSFLDPELGVETATEDWLTVTSSSDYFDFSDSSGFTLQVPDGALPPEDPSCTVEVKSVIPGQSGVFVYPDSSKPISAIYHISSSTTQLCRPVEFTMEHFGLQEDPSKTSSCKFVAASSMGDLPYKFSSVSEQYDVQTSDGQVTLESLAPTFLAIVQEEANGPGIDKELPVETLHVGGTTGDRRVTEFVHNIGGVGILESPLLGMEDLVDGAATEVWNLLIGGLSGWEQHSNGYCAMLFCRCPYPDSGDCRLDLDFVIVKNDNFIIAFVQKCYSGFHMVRRPGQMIVRFSQGAQHLTIGIGDDGAETDDGKWHIVPSLTPLRIRKDDVDNYNGGTAVPACQLTVKQQVPGRIPEVSYRFTMQGTDTKTVLFEMDPQRDFHSNLGVGTKEAAYKQTVDVHKECGCCPAVVSVLCLHYSGQPHKGDNENIAKTTLKSEADFKGVRKALYRVRYKWRAIGIEFGFSIDDLSSIASEPTLCDHDAHLSEMIALCLKRRDPRPTWKELIEALQSETVGEEGLAADLKEKLTQK